MPKLGMEKIRRAELIDATISLVGESGVFDVTVSQIARRAGVSSALAHHYFGTKDEIFLSAMHHVLSIYSAEVRTHLQGAVGPRERLTALVRANFAESNFRPEVVGAWLNFYALAQGSEAAARLLNIYRRRLRSNLLHALRPLVGQRAEAAAEGVAAMIDGLYLRGSLRADAHGRERAESLVLDYVDRLLEPDT